MPNRRLLMSSRFILPAAAVLLTAGAAFAVNAFAASFTEPSSAPPNGNAYAPLDTSPSTNDKPGTISADHLFSRFDTYFASNSGNVGIGTLSPGRKLDIDNGLSAAGNGSARILGYQAAWEVFNRAGTANWYFGNNDADANKLYIGRGYGPNQGLTPYLAITQNGNVGIEAVNPVTKLDVFGNVGADAYCDRNGANCSTPGQIATAVANTGGSSITSYNQLPSGSIAGYCGADAAGLAATPPLFPPAYINSGAQCACPSGWTLITVYPAVACTNQEGGCLGAVAGADSCIKN